MSEQPQDVTWVGCASCSPVHLMLQSSRPGDVPGDVPADVPVEVPPLLAPSLLEADFTSQLQQVVIGLAEQQQRCPAAHKGPWHHVERMVRVSRQRQQLLLVRDYCVCVKRVSDVTQYLAVVLERDPLPDMGKLSALALELGGHWQHSVSLHRRLLRDLCSSSSAHTLHRKLNLLLAEALVLLEQSIVSMVKSLARAHIHSARDLLQVLTVYNQLLCGRAKWIGMEPFPLPRVLQVLAQERALALSTRFLQTLASMGLGAALHSDIQTCDPSPVFCVQHLLPAPCVSPWVQDFRNALLTLIEEDRNQIDAILQTLISAEPITHKLAQHRDPGTVGTVPALYSHYCAHLWPVFYSNMYHAFYSQLSTAVPSLPVCGDPMCLALLRILHGTLASVQVPELCRKEGQTLCARLISSCLSIAWDRVLCQALSSMMTDKCVLPCLSPGTTNSWIPRSRTAGILVQLCDLLSFALSSTSAGSEVLPGCPDRVFGSRCVATLSLCDTWLRARTQLYHSTGSLGPLLLVTHGDLPVLQAEAQRLCSLITETGTLTSAPRNKVLSLQIQRLREGIEVLSGTLPHSLGSLCTRLAQDMFLNLMPTGRHWRGKFSEGNHVTPSEYIVSSANYVLVPIVGGVCDFPQEWQVSALSAALRAFLEAWMAHILQQRLKFSLQGALQLRCDFESLRGLLQSSDSGLSPDVIQTLLSLPVFQQSDNAVTCLLQQPTRKSYLHSCACPLLFCCAPLCRVAVENVSDSLQSLDRLERRAWDRRHSADVPRQNHDSYLLHNQRQWLSLRVHRGWGALRVPWDGP
ncbi:coiled-coil domain-containing protein 142 isoform X2 [Xenopus laevis]|uniref:Coiled-coil domain-containing protein 142 isoform X2 n=2 Tax=Xenopus laevis TaxID=8355 RepID=A0A1L8HK58_XENLA|nr:coiled-coil domain-containing protein 142 isoform X2 [Xenopus laevis]XP_018098421.1 coiled-coil domain-containing protein 142 isoform X2 [Xenopus laevis]XP_018098422.1 coiled-coil domain-containing protein 142 isoform X2 [Xenopus laevis]OCT96455.1 hypothetical protein XELAEV_18008661mg [Xenopus laevis]